MGLDVTDVAARLVSVSEPAAALGKQKIAGAKMQDATSTPYPGVALWCMVLTNRGATFMAARGSCPILRAVFVLGALGMTAGTKLLVTPSMREKIAFAKVVVSTKDSGRIRHKNNSGCNSTAHDDRGLTKSNDARCDVSSLCSDDGDKDLRWLDACRKMVLGALPFLDLSWGLNSLSRRERGTSRSKLSSSPHRERNVEMLGSSDKHEFRTLLLSST